MQSPDGVDGQTEKRIGAWRHNHQWNHRKLYFHYEYNNEGEGEWKQVVVPCDWSWSPFNSNENIIQTKPYHDFQTKNVCVGLWILQLLFKEFPCKT